MTISTLILSFAVQGTILGADSPPLPTVQLEAEITGRVYYGIKSTFDPAKKQKVGTVRSQDVYLQIPAYQEIVKEGVERNSARWNKLMKKATAVFKRAIKSVASNSNCVLVVEDGGVSGYPITDLTAAVIEAV